MSESYHDSNASSLPVAGAESRAGVAAAGLQVRALAVLSRAGSLARCAGESPSAAARSGTRTQNPPATQEVARSPLAASNRTSGCPAQRRRRPAAGRHTTASAYPIGVEFTIEESSTQMKSCTYVENRAYSEKGVKRKEYIRNCKGKLDGCSKLKTLLIDVERGKSFPFPWNKMSAHMDETKTEIIVHKSAFHQNYQTCMPIQSQGIHGAKRDGFGSIDDFLVEYTPERKSISKFLSTEEFETAHLQENQLAFHLGSSFVLDVNTSSGQQFFCCTSSAAEISHHKKVAVTSMKRTYSRKAKQPVTSESKEERQRMKNREYQRRFREKKFRLELQQHYHSSPPGVSTHHLYP